MIRVFFNKRGEQKPWVIIVNTLFPIVFSILGIWLAIKSYTLSIATSQNREQIDTLTKIIGEIRKQNTLLQELVLKQDTQVKAYLAEVRYNRRPRLVGQIGPAVFSGEISDVTINISNLGGDIYSFRYEPLKEISIDSTSLPQNGFLPSGGHVDIRFMNLTKTKYKARFYFKDALMNSYVQELILFKYDSEYVLQFGSLQEIQH